MAEAKPKKGMISHGIVAQNRKARYDYTIKDTVEAGMVLKGPEVKSLRHGRATLTEAWAGEREGELYLFNAYIPEYHGGNRFNHEVRRPRKLLLHKREVNKLIGTIKRGGFTLIPLSIYFNDKGRAKIAIALGKGKKLHDKRESEKVRDWNRDKSRLMREKG